MAKNHKNYLILLGLMLSQALWATVRQPCPEESPYWCNDGNCVSDFALCQSVIACPEPLSHACPDGACVEDESDCFSFQDACAVEHDPDDAECGSP